MKSDRDELVLAAPDEHRLGLKLLQPGPKAVVAVGLVEVDVAGGRVEGGAAARGQVGAQELVDARGRPAVVAPGTSRRTIGSTSGAGSAGCSPSSGGSEPAAATSRGARAARPERGRAGRAAPPGRDARSPASIAIRPPMLLPARWRARCPSASSSSTTAREPAGVVAAPRRLARSRRSPAGRRRSPGSRRRARRRSAGTTTSCRRARAGRRAARPRRPQRSRRSSPRLIALEAQPLGLGVAARGGQEADAEVEVLADRQAAGAESGHPARTSVGDLVPGRGIGASTGVGLARSPARGAAAGARSGRRTRAPSLDGEADPGALPAHVDRRGIEALDQPAQRPGRRGGFLKRDTGPGLPTRGPRAVATEVPGLDSRFGDQAGLNR